MGLVVPLLPGLHSCGLWEVVLLWSPSLGVGVGVGVCVCVGVSLCVCVCGCVIVSLCVCVLVAQSCLFATPRIVARQASLSMDFSKQEYWSGLPLPSPCGKVPACRCKRCKRCGFVPWVGKIPWRRLPCRFCRICQLPGQVEFWPPVHRQVTAALHFFL